jgi:SAM-dependent methyltransferase
MASGAIAVSRYSHKTSPYSSHSALLDLLPADGRGRRALDVGCASGYLAEILAQRGYEVVGVERPGGYGDSFPESVELIEADLERGAPPLRGRFSYIICGDILEHLREPERLLEQLAEALEPDGMLVASLPNSGNLYFRLTILLGDFPRTDRGLFDRTHLHFFMWKQWRELLESCGLAVRSRKVTAIPLGLALPQWEGAVLRALEWVSYQLARIRPTLFAYQFVVVAVRRRS